MAINPNPSRENKNTLYLAVSGGGKSQALKQNKEVPRRGVRHLLFDPNHDHKATRVKGDARKFAQVVAKAIKSGKGFRLAWDVEPTPENLDAFCHVVYLALDGRHETFVTCEEIAAASESAGRATTWARRLMNEGRKYGLVFHGTSQKPQEIPKTFYDQCPHKWVGQQMTRNQRRKMADEIGATVDDIASLESLEFLVSDGSAKAPRRVQLTYKNT